MFAQFKTLFLVALLQTVEMLAFYTVSWMGLGPYHALNGVGGVALLILIVVGVIFANESLDKAASPKGTPRLSLDANVFLWYGFATTLSVMFATGLVESVKDGAYVYLIIQMASIAVMCVLASKALAAEVQYVSRQKPPSFMYVPFFAAATTVPAMLAILPLWAVAAGIIFQIAVVGALLFSPWSPLEKRGRKAA